MQAQPPASCEQACSLSNAGNCKAGDVTGNPSGDPQCAESRIGIPTYTTLSTFGSLGSCVDGADNNRCASGSCISYQGKTTFGVAHRTFPMGTRLEVCNVKNGICSIATVLERGPASYVGKVTVDARVELGQALQIGCNSSAPATYTVLSVPGVAKSVQPTGPTTVGIEAILAAQSNGSGVPVSGMSYSAVNTPWGPGYLGTPPPFNSGAYNSIGTAPQQIQLQPSGISGNSASLATNNSANNTQGSAQVVAGNSNSAPEILGPGSLAILVQPRISAAGSSIIVSWTSVNMKQFSCDVKRQGQQFAGADHGTKPYRTTTNDSGSVTFTVTCKDLNGIIREATGSAIVQ